MIASPLPAPQLWAGSLETVGTVVTPEDSSEHRAQPRLGSEPECGGGEPEHSKEAGARIPSLVFGLKKKKKVVGAPMASSHRETGMCLAGTCFWL